MQWLELEQKLINRGLLPNQARELIWEAISSEVIKVVRTAPMVEDQVLSGEIPQESILSSVREKIGVGIIVTMPAAVSEESTSPTLLTFAQIIAAAQNTIYLISPYIDDKGIEMLHSPLLEAKKRGVQLRIITRETAKRQVGRTRGLESLFSLFANQMSVRDYHTEAEGLSHYTSVHAKLIQADDQIGYVGSAELRGNALEKNFEMGCILTTEQAALSLTAFKSVWQIARPVMLWER
jgi:phosphatidylserine/phosphatidylglycerophosphate/cardiolipin synthase-like enzyme